MDSSTMCTGLCQLTHRDHNSELPDHGIHLQNVRVSSFASDEGIPNVSSARTILYPWNNFICPSARSGIACAVTFGGRVSHPLFSSIDPKTISSTYILMHQRWAWETCVDITDGSVSSSPSAYRTDYTFKNANWAWETSVDAFYESSVDNVALPQREKKGTSESLKDLCIKVLSEEHAACSSSSCPNMHYAPKIEKSASSPQLSRTTLSTESAVQRTSSTISMLSEADSELSLSTSGSQISLTTVTSSEFSSVADSDLALSELGSQISLTSVSSTESLSSLVLSLSRFSSQYSLTSVSSCSELSASSELAFSEADSNLSLSRSSSHCSLNSVSSAETLSSLVLSLSQYSSQYSLTSISSCSTSSSELPISEVDSNLSLSQSSSQCSLTPVASTEDSLSQLSLESISYVLLLEADSPSQSSVSLSAISSSENLLETEAHPKSSVEATMLAKESKDLSKGKRKRSSFFRRTRKSKSTLKSLPKKAMKLLTAVLLDGIVPPKYPDGYLPLRCKIRERKFEGQKQ